MSKVKNWCFVDFMMLDWESKYNGDDCIQYIGWCKEICPTTLREHNQGWLQLKQRKRLSYLKQIAPAAHWEACRGSEETNEKYCRKDVTVGNTFNCFGSFTTQGTRTDLNEVKAYIKDNKSCREVAEKFFPQYLKFNRGIEKYITMQEKVKRRNWRTVEVWYLCGPTGCGKTRQVMDLWPDCYKIQGYGLQWWDGYEGEDVLLIDEYINNVNIGVLLSLLDGYRLRLAVKGGFTYANWTKVYITSNYRLEELHERASTRNRDALKRRISQVLDFYPGAGPEDESGQGITGPDHHGFTFAEDDAEILASSPVEESTPGA